MANAAERSGRLAHDVRLIPVTKSVGAQEIETLYKLGFNEMGENRIEQLISKFDALKHIASNIQWHMIGSIQRRKTKDIVQYCSYIDSVDRLELAQTISNIATETGKTLPILIEINISGESTKHGFPLDDAPHAIDKIRAMPSLSVEGLMTMAPFTDNPEQTRPFFKSLHSLAQKMNLTQLSMGMTNDFEIAIEEGATQVRIGTALYI